MVGGTIREVFRTVDGTIALLIRGKGEDKDKMLAVNVKDEGDVLAPGDDVWWQGDKLMWNPTNGRWLDKQLERASHTYEADSFWRQAAILARDGICPVCTSRDEAMTDGEGRVYCNQCGASYDLSDMLDEGE